MELFYYLNRNRNLLKNLFTKKFFLPIPIIKIKIVIYLS